MRISVTVTFLNACECAETRAKVASLLFFLPRQLRPRHGASTYTLRECGEQSMSAFVSPREVSVDGVASKPV